MADPPAKNRGGRPRLPGQAKYIRLRSSVFDLWRQQKTDLGFQGKTDSIFAEFLLHSSNRTVEIFPDHQWLDDGEPSWREANPQFASTPQRPRMRTAMPAESKASDSNSYVNVTSTMSGLLLEANPMLNSIRGNPFSMLENAVVQPGEEDQEALDSDAEYSDEDGSDGVDEDVELLEDDNERIDAMMSSIIQVMCDERGNSSDEESDASDTEIGLFRDDVHIAQENGEPSEETLENELTKTSIEVPIDEDAMSERVDVESRVGDASSEGLEERVEGETTERVEGAGDTDERSNTVEANYKQVMADLENKIKKLTDTKDLQDLTDLHSRLRLLVSIEKLVELAGSACTFIVDGGLLCGCPREYTSHPHSSCVEIRWHCSKGHYGKWESSEVLTRKGNSDVYLNDCLLAISIIISGNNYAKFLLLCKALNLKVLGSTSFCNFQKNCALPVIKDVWSSMNNVILEILGKYKDVCIAGDGRNDSPGHSARYCVYTIMEHVTKVVVDLEVLDKRETGGNSTAMEKEGLRRLMERLVKELNLGELVTDASSTIIKLIRDFKGNHAQLLELFHSLDIWHKSKKLSKGLHQAAKVKGCEDLKDWIDPIVNHFWYCCQMAEGDTEELKNMWQGVLHHVCGEHSWAESQCSHGTHVETESSKKPLPKNSKAMAALRKVVVDDKWMKTLHFYTKFRHTGDLENFNSMMLKYAPKRNAFEYPYFIMRILLAEIDHNHHLFRKPKKGKDGEPILHRKFSKRTNRYHAEVVKEEKAYTYFPYLVARMLESRRGFEGSFKQRSSEGFDPKQIAPTI